MNMFLLFVYFIDEIKGCCLGIGFILFFSAFLAFLRDTLQRTSLAENATERRIKNFKERACESLRRNCCYYILLFILSGIFFTLGYSFYLLKNAKQDIETYPSRIPPKTLLSVSPIQIQDNKTPKFYFRYNPSFIRVNISNETYYFVAIRESTSQECTNYIYRLKSFTEKEIDSHIVFGIGKNLTKLKFAGSMTIINNSENVTYPGFEDPRLFKYHNNEKIGIINGHMFQLYISKITFEKITEKKYDLIEESRFLIKPQFPAAERQKNWVRFPAERKGNNKPWFVYNFNPLIIVDIDLDTGNSNLISIAPKIECIKGFVKGSTNLIKSPFEEDLYIGIVHRSEWESEKNISIYNSSFIGIKYDKENLQIIIDSLSNPFKIPGEIEDKMRPEQSNANNIHFPMGLDCLGEKCERLLVSMGQMDCDALSVEFDTVNVMKMLYKVTCE